MPKVRVLTSYPLYCALPVKDQPLPLHLRKEIPFIFTELFSVFFFPGTSKKKKKKKELDWFKDLPECVEIANTSRK